MAYDYQKESTAFTSATLRYRQKFKHSWPLMDGEELDAQTRQIEKHLASGEPLDKETREFWLNHA